MFYQFLADLVVIIHFLFIVFGLLGGLLVLWRKWIVLLHLPAAVWMVGIAFLCWICPLTYLEDQLRSMGGMTGYKGEFVEYYLIPLIYPYGLTHEIQIVLGMGALGINVLIYFFIIRS